MNNSDHQHVNHTLHSGIYNKCNTCNAILHCWEFIGNLSPIKAVTLWQKKKKSHALILITNISDFILVFFIFFYFL